MGRYTLRGCDAALMQTVLVHGGAVLTCARHSFGPVFVWSALVVIRGTCGCVSAIPLCILGPCVAVCI